MFLHVTHMMVLLVLCALLHQTVSQCLSDDDDMSKILNKSEEERLQGRKELRQSQLQFSLDLLQTVGTLDPSMNVFFSPLSVYNALLLAYFVSANQTEISLKDILRLPEKQKKSDTWQAYTQEQLAEKLQFINATSNALYKLGSSNRMYVSDKYKVRSCVKERIGGDIEEADFSQNISKTIATINKWVSTKTGNNINDLLSEDSLNANTNLVLVNAAYFRGFWKTQFSPSDTKEADFRLDNGTKVPVMLMSVESMFSHRLNEKLDAEVLELPYEGDDISMFILLPLTPSDTAISDLLNKTDAETLLEVVNESPSALNELTIHIPKFSVEQSIELTPILESMGVGDLFQSSADLSSLTGVPELQVDTAIHKAKIAVDEAGTEAAASTAIFANRFASESFLANHPFIYFLFDKKSNVLLFAGIFNSPQT